MVATPAAVETGAVGAAATEDPFTRGSLSARVAAIAVCSAVAFIPWQVGLPEKQTRSRDRP